MWKLKLARFFSEDKEQGYWDVEVRNNCESLQ